MEKKYFPWIKHRSKGSQGRKHLAAFIPIDLAKPNTEDNFLMPALFYRLTSVYQFVPAYELHSNISDSN